MTPNFDWLDSLNKFLTERGQPKAAKNEDVFKFEVAPSRITIDSMKEWAFTHDVSLRRFGKDFFISDE